ncbi:MAG: VanZ family protein [Candidatus Nanoarchaeia archaeon]|jgi:VanZ family protein
MKARGFLYYWFPVIIYAGIIFYFSSLSNPLPQGMPSFNYMDLLLHSVEYLILSVLLLRALLHYNTSHPYLFSIAIAALYGISDEFHQLFVPGRFFAVSDMAADAFGASLILIYLLTKHTKSYKTRKAIQ